MTAHLSLNSAVTGSRINTDEETALIPKRVLSSAIFSRCIASDPLVDKQKALRRTGLVLSF